MAQQVAGINHDLLEALQGAVQYLEIEGSGQPGAGGRSALNRARAAIKRATEIDPTSVPPSREHIQSHTFAEWVMRAQKDAAHAVNALEAVAERYDALETRMAGVAADRDHGSVTVGDLVAHLREFFPIAVGRAAAAQHVDPDPVRGPLGNGPCGCSVRE